MTEITTQVQHVDLSIKELLAAALRRNEGVLSSNGALVTKTGKRTGRSPKDRFIVEDDITREQVDWGNVNQPLSSKIFEQLWQQASNYLEDKETFVSNLQVGADPEYNLPVKVITEFAWHNLFARHLFIRPEQSDTDSSKSWTILSVPGMNVDPRKYKVNTEGVVIINFTEQCVLLCGMRYAGEMKKSMFSVLNFLLTEHDVLPMHCSANQGENGDVTLFFGLSGTGKTTLSSDPSRYLIGDDEHGWSDDRVFNFEGGCYAKCIDLSQEREPVIWSAIKDGAIMENVVIDEQGAPDFSDGSLTENTRAAYPRDFIEKCVPENYGPVPNAVIFLCCDLYGVLPPISMLTVEQAAYYFLSGYTAKLGSTEVGSASAIQPAFSRCFGEPFFPRHASVYSKLLMKHLQKTRAQTYLVNTGWTGGAYQKGGQRFAIPTTRAVVHAAQNGHLLNTETETLAGFNVSIPKSLPGIDAHQLNPRISWSDEEAFVKNSNELIQLFRDNFKQYTVTDAINNSGPELISI